ncbi:hypothetical protein ACFV90_36795 [Streptomyces sp. NPDC059904]|uniref:hypothetical protein n=1 Tax=Streptomyces sp. NPDC059904 TaxID=3346996 RepID=UPI0036629F70
MTQPLPSQLPDRTDGQSALTLSDATVAAAVEHAIEESRRNDTSPKVVIGNTPPVAQPGRPPMSQSATDASALMLTGSVLTAVLGGSATAVLWASGHADPVVVACICGAPTVGLLALKGVVKSVKRLVPDENHHHYNGPVSQEYSATTNNNRWWGRSSTKN